MTVDPELLRRDRESRETRLSAFTAFNASQEYPKPLDEAAFHGVAGRYVRAVEPHTEADPAGILIQFLVACGNALGRGPHMMVGRSRHGVNLFAVTVGSSAKGRKGMATDEVRSILLSSVPDWVGRMTSGLASGEGLIHAVRDSVEINGKVVDAGVSDKRLLVLEGEFARVLRVAAREGNILSAVIRDAWDGITLRNMTRTSPATATRPHISIIGHITADDLSRHLSESEMLNGYGNRFLWVAVQRSKCLPFGGDLPEHELAAITADLRHVLLTQRDEHRLSWGTARDRWAAIYPELSEARPGLLGAMTARSEAQTLRLAMLYAVLDGSTVIDTPHLNAALAVWDCCDRSAKWIFGEKSGDLVADTLLRELRSRPDGLTRHEMYDMFSGVIRLREPAARAGGHRAPRRGADQVANHGHRDRKWA